MKITEAIKTLETFANSKNTPIMVKSALDMAIEALKEQRPHGEWKYNPDCVNDEMQAEFFCSICNRGAYSRLDNFCPNCGADMRKRGG